MGWIDLKFKELDEAAKAQEAPVSKSGQDHNASMKLSAKAWGSLAEALRADVEQYNAHPSAKKRVGIRVMQHPQLIEVFWKGETRVLLHISSKKDEPGFAYSALSMNAAAPEQYNGHISPKTESEFVFVNRFKQPLDVDLAKLSEELLSPVLFP